MMHIAMRRFVFAATVMVGGLGQANAAFVITFAQSGSDVVATGTGSLDFSDLTFVEFDYGPQFVDPSAGAVLLGPVPAQFTDVYVGDILGPTTFGPGSLALATSGNTTAPDGTGVGINGAAQQLYLPGGYFAGDLITVSTTWANTTLSGLGLAAGTYTWTWGTFNPDSLTVIIPATTAVPEPSTLLSSSIAVLAIGGLARRRRQAA